MVSGGVLGPLVAQSSYLQIFLLIILLLLYYPVPSPYTTVTMPSRPSLGGGEGEGQVQRVQHGSGLPFGTHSSENITFRGSITPSENRAGVSDGRTVTSVIVVVNIPSRRNGDSKSSSSSSQIPPLYLSCRDNS